MAPTGYARLDETRDAPYDPHPSPVGAATTDVAEGVPAEVPRAQTFPDGPPPVARVAPAGAVPTAVAMPMDSAYGFPARGANPDLPDAIEAWNGLRALMTGYMAASVVMLFFSIWVFPISLPLAILGIIASSMHLFERCRGRGSIVGAVITIKVLSAVVATMSLSLAIIWILIACSVAVGELIAVFTVLTLIYAAFGALSLHVFNRVKYVNALMLPVAEGIVQV
jgi:hypothetical protein